MTESRQVRRARERRQHKARRSTYPTLAQRDGSAKHRIHKNRRHRGDGLDYFK